LKITAPKTHIKFLKDVLNQVADDRETFNLAKTQAGKKSRESLSADELLSNLTVVNQAIVKDSESDTGKHMLVGKRVRHRFQVEKDKWYTGKIISQVYDNEMHIYNNFHICGH
jgi:hypothetical protein